MRHALCLTLLSFPLLLAAQSLETRYDRIGSVIVLRLASAPFPAALRANGHEYGGRLYPADMHYSDSTVAVFVPKGFRKDGPLELVVHIHGWFNNVDSVFAQFRLAEQLAASGRNALLVVPQGPKNAPDSYGGKLEEPGAFKRFVDDVVAALRERRVTSAETARSVVISGHSGAYRMISFILSQGGMTDRIREVYLFDAIYGQLEKFGHWLDRSDGRFVAITTDSGGTKETTQQLKDDLRAWGIPFADVEETAATPDVLRANRVVFIHTDLEHNQVLSEREEFRKYLETGSLEKQ